MYVRTFTTCMYTYGLKLDNQTSLNFIFYICTYMYVCSMLMESSKTDPEEAANKCVCVCVCVCVCLCVFVSV